MDEITVLNKEKFSLEVQEFVAKCNSSYIDAVLELCQKKELDFEIVTSLLSRQIIEKIEAEAVELNLIKKDEVSLF